jgi:glycosyltransferase involved in cell wall biosynthesis
MSKIRLGVLINKIKYLILVFLNFFAIGLRVNQFNSEKNSKNRSLRVLLIGHGEVVIPTPGWGAVETIIHETNEVLMNHNFVTGVLNSKSIFTWLQAKRFSPKVILLHDDSKLLRAKIFWPRAIIVLITHYGYAGFPDKWGQQYRRRVTKTFNLANKIVCLSPRILEEFAKYINPSKLILSPNGTSLNPQIVSHEIQKKFICLGKIEQRKKQYEIYKHLLSLDFEVDFFGKVEDPRVKICMSEETHAARCFKGPISRDELNLILSNYAGLILTSDGEADSLVLYEAQMAGLPLVVSRNSVGSQDLALPWIKTIGNLNDLPKVLKEILASNFNKVSISQFAQMNYNWETRMQNLLSYLMEFSLEEETFPDSKKFK